MVATAPPSGEEFTTPPVVGEPTLRSGGERRRCTSARDPIGAHAHLWILAGCIAAQPFSTAAGNIAFGIAVATSIVRAPHLAEDWLDCLRKPWVLCLLAWVAWSFLTLLWSPDPGFGIRQYRSLRVLLWIPILWPYRCRWRFLGAAMVVSACALVPVQGAQVFAGAMRFGHQHVGGGWVHPTQTGVWQATALVGLVSATAFGAWRLIALALPIAAILGFGVVFTASRAAVLSAAAGFGAMTLAPIAARPPLRTRAFRRVAVLVLVATAVAVGAMQTSPRLVAKFREATTDTGATLATKHDGANGESVAEYRLAMWIMGLNAWRSHPIAGWGIGSIPTIAQETTVSHPRHDMRKVAMIHSTYLHALVEGGIVGAGLLLCTLVLGARAAWCAMQHDLARAGPACAAACWLVAACFDGYHQSGGLLSIGAIIVPLACGPVRQQA